MNTLMNWFTQNENLLAVLVTVGFGVLLLCGLSCSQCSKRDKDDLFRRRHV